MIINTRAIFHFSGTSTGLSMTIEPGQVWCCGHCRSPLSVVEYRGRPIVAAIDAKTGHPIVYSGAFVCPFCESARLFDRVDFVPV